MKNGNVERVFKRLVIRVSCLAVVLGWACPVYVWGGLQAQAGEALKRRKIAFVNRQLDQERPRYSLKDRVLPEGGRLALPKEIRLQDLAAVMKKAGEQVGEGEVEGEGLKLGNVDAGLKGGQFSTYTLFRYGLDTGKSLGENQGLVVLLKPEEGRAGGSPVGGSAPAPVGLATGVARGVSFVGSERLNTPVRSILPGALQEEQRHQWQGAMEGTGGFVAGGLGAGALFGSVNFEGMKASIDAGPFKLDLLNWRKEPKREKKEFFGNNGPTYLLGVPVMFPGTEKVYVNGSQLTVADYVLDTARGELRLSKPASTSDRISLEYDLMGSMDAQPGQFTGIRLGGELNGLPLGVSLMSQQIIGFERRLGGEVEKKVREQRLTGFDGSFKLAGQTITVETATSTGDRKRSAGTLNTVALRTTDTLDPFGSTDGPYQLPQAQLPVVEGSAQVFIDGFAAPSGHYVLDNQAGRLTFQKGVIRFTGTERIEVRYRTQNDVTGSGGSPRLAGSASKFGLKGSFPRNKEEETTAPGTSNTGYLGGGQPKGPAKGLNYELSTENTDANFFTMGSGGTGAAGQSKKTRQRYEYGLSEGHFLKFSREESSQMVDEASGLKGENTAEAFAWHFSGSKVLLDLKRDKSGQTSAANSENTGLKVQGKFLAAEALSLGFSWKENDQHTGGRRTERSARELSALYAPHERLSAVLRLGKEENTDNAPGANSTDGPLASLALQLKPMEMLSFVLERGHTPTAGDTEKLAMTYQPGAWLDVDVLHEVGESPTLGEGLTQKPVSGTRQKKQAMKLSSRPFEEGRFQSLNLAYQMGKEDVTGPSGARANDNAQLTLKYTPRPALNLSWTRQWRNQEEPGTKSDNTLQMLAGNLKLMKRWGVDLSRTLVDQTSGTNAVNSQQWSLTVKAPRQQFLKELDIHIKRDGQGTDSGVLTLLGKSISRQTQQGTQVQLQAKPIWENRLVMLSVISRTTRISGQAGTQDETVRGMMEVPFVGGSHLEFTHERTRRKQASGKAKDLSYEAMLKETVSERLVLSGGYRAKNSTDVTGLGRTEEQWSLEGNLSW